MSAITLEQTDLHLEFSHGGIQLRTSRDVLTTIQLPELVWRPKDVRCWLSRSEGVLIVTATHASRVFRIHLDTGAVEVAAELDRRFSEVLGDQLQFMVWRQACGGTLLLLYEAGLVCLESNGELRWHHLHNDITAMLLGVDDEHVCIEKHLPNENTATKTYFRLEDGNEVSDAA